MEKITIKDICILVADSIFSASCAFGLIYIAFLLDAETFKVRWLPIIEGQYWRLAVAIGTLALMYFLFVRFWRYKENKTIPKSRLWALFTRNCLAMMIVFVFAIMATLVLFFNSPSLQNPLVNCKGMAFCLGAFLTYLMIKNSRKYYEHNKET